MKKLLCLCSLLAVLVLPMGAGAGLIQYEVTVTVGSDEEVFSGEGQADGDGYFEFVLVPLNTDQTVEKLILRGNSDPEVGIEFGVRNYGSSALAIGFLAVAVTFDPIVDPIAYASAGVTLTDRNVPANGAAITGLFDGGKVHQARYNGLSVFANLVSGYAIGGGTVGSVEAKPSSGSEIIIGALTSIQSEFRFTLSANDSASGTSTFVVIPEPATVGILSIGAVLALLKKQRR